MIKNLIIIQTFFILRVCSRKIIWAVVVTQIIFPAYVMMLFLCLILGFVSLSKLLLMCLMFHIRVAHSFGMLKKETKTNFTQAYLIWVPKLDRPKIGIPLSQWT